MLTVEQLQAALGESYMDAAQLEFFEYLLMDLKHETLRSMDAARMRLASPPETNDEGDRASYEEESQLALRIMDRERKLIPKIDKALQRIKNGEYGYCLESGEPIGIARLLIRPTAEYSAEIKAIKEQKEAQYSR